MFESFFGKKPAVETEVKVEELTTEQYDSRMEEIINRIKELASDSQNDDEIIKLNFEASKIFDKTTNPDLNRKKINSVMANLN